MPYFAGRSYVYLACDSASAARQRQALQRAASSQLPAEIALLVLVECIHHPEVSFKQLADAIAHRTHVTVEVAQIEKLFDQHGLKKTIRAGAKKLSTVHS
jgi:hypothetical protein